MKSFRFNFNTEYARDLRDAVNDRQKHSIENVHKEEQTKGEYRAWGRTCAAMDRLEDTLAYLNEIELGKYKKLRSAFDFYDFINNSYIVIDCIKTIGNIFGVDNALIKEIETSTSVFGNRFGENCTDAKYFEYIRSLCSVHPLCTNHQKEFLNGSKFHCCPFVIWEDGLRWRNRENADLTAVIYPSEPGANTIYHGLYVAQFERYLTKWIDFIPKITEAKNIYTDNIYASLRKEPVQYLSEFDNNIPRYLIYLKGEYCKRFDDDNDYLFDDAVNFFTIKLTDSRNSAALQKFQNAIVYSLSFVRNELQNMSYEGYENNGIKHPESWIETTLFDSLMSIFSHGSAFAEFSYNLEKIYYLKPNGNYSEYDKMYARALLNDVKEALNQYVHFTNTEPDGERVVLVHLAKYLEALTRKNLLNKNIPNTLDYRIQVLSDEQYSKLFMEEARKKPSTPLEDLIKQIEKYEG